MHYICAVLPSILSGRSFHRVDLRSFPHCATPSDRHNFLLFKVCIRFISCHNHYLGFVSRLSTMRTAHKLNPRRTRASCVLRSELKSKTPTAAGYQREYHRLYGSNKRRAKSLLIRDSFRGKDQASFRPGQCGPSNCQWEAHDHPRGPEVHLPQRKPRLLVYKGTFIMSITTKRINFGGSVVGLSACSYVGPSSSVSDFG